MQGYQQLSDTGHGQVETVNGLHGNVNTTKPDLSGTDGVNHAVERPKLNLKPRSQAPEQFVGNIDGERSVLSSRIFLMLLSSSFSFIR